MKNNDFIRMLLIIIAVVYFVAPDLIPGPIDDVLAVVLALNFGNNKQLTKND